MKADVLILGGGFAGRQACRPLRDTRTKVGLIDSRTFTTMLPALPDLAGGWISPDLVHQPLRKLLPAEIQIHTGTVSTIDLDARQLTVDGALVPYRHLLIAPGSTPLPPPPSFSLKRLYLLGSLEEALRIREEFVEYLETTSHPQLLVAGTGYTGLELAMSLAFRARSLGTSCGVTLVDPTPVLLPSLPDRQRQYVMDFLHAQNVDVLLGTSIDSYDGQVARAGGRTFEFPFFCWATGSRFAIPEVHGSASRLPDGRFLVADDLSLPGYPDVFAAGDAAAILHHGRPLRKAVNFAYYGGRHAGRNIARRLHGRPSRPFRPVDLGWIVPFHSTSIGRLAPGIWIHGLLGVRLHHFMCGLRNYSFDHFTGCLRLALNPDTKGTLP